MRRREFICIPFGAALCLLIKGCGGSGSQQRIQPPDIILSDDEDPQKLAKRLSGLYSKLEQLSNDTSRCLRIGFKCGDRMDVLRLHFCDPENGVADYKHVRIVRESTDEAIRLIWGRDGIVPTVKFVNDGGEVLKDSNGKEMEFKVKDLTGASPTKPIDWLSLGAKVLAIGFAVWLGAEVAKLVVSAIAFIAFNAMVIGALMMLAGLVKWFIDLTGLTWEDVKSFMSQTVEKLAQALVDGANFIMQAFSQ
jgi:hypothetical protein